MGNAIVSLDNWQWGAVAVLILVAIYFIHKKQSSKRENQKVTVFHQENEGLFGHVQDNLKRARDNVCKAQDDLNRNDKTDLGLAVRRANKDITELIAKVERAPGTHPDALNRSLKGDVAAHAWAMDGMARNVLAESEKLLSAAREGKDNAVQAAVETLTAETKNAMNRFRDRKVGKT